MLDNQTKDKFIELRADGWTYDRIAEHLNVSKRTLLRWNLDMKNEIKNLQALQREAARERLLGSYLDWTQRLVTQFNRVEKELSERDLGYVETEDVFKMFTTLQSRLDRNFAEPELTDEPSPAKPDKTGQNPDGTA